MPLADRLDPRVRKAVRLPGPWPACARGALRRGAHWLHEGGPGGWGGDLLVPVSGPRLESRWLEGAWRTTRDGEALGGTPFESLAATAAGSRFPLLGALSFELACWEAGLPLAGPPQGALGMVWTEVREALSLDATGAEALGWDRTAGGAAPWVWPDGDPARGQAGPLVPAWTSGRHRQEVEAIRHRILDGDFYVANLCVPFEARVEGDALAFALDALRRASPPFGAVLDLGDRVLLSLSMERALSLEAGRLRCEPIKGTCPRTGDPALDAAAALRLGSDPKERAEHTMIVDLVRNDLGRVARTGSVEVTASMAVRPYGTVQHLVSAVEADLAPGAGLAGILRAVLPGGSVTGAPKHAVCRHLAAVEAGPRGFYCGALGWIGAGGRAFDLAMPIRTAELRAGVLTYWAGGGITRLSDPEAEWKEVLLKARAITG